VSLAGSDSLSTWSALLIAFMWNMYYEQWAMSATASKPFREESVRCLTGLSSFPCCRTLQRVRCAVSTFLTNSQAGRSPGQRAKTAKASRCHRGVAAQGREQLCACTYTSTPPSPTVGSCPLAQKHHAMHALLLAGAQPCAPAVPLLSSGQNHWRSCSL